MLSNVGLVFVYLEKLINAGVKPSFFSQRQKMFGGGKLAVVLAPKDYMATTAGVS